MGYVAGEDVLMGVLPWFHIYGQTVVALACLKAGAAIVSMPKFLPELFLKITKDYKVPYKVPYGTIRYHIRYHMRPK